MNWKINLKKMALIKFIQILAMYSSPAIAVEAPSKPTWPMTCHCPRIGQTWIIEADKVSVQPDKERNSERFRHLASGPVEIQAVRTQQTAEGMSKVVHLNGQQITIGLRPGDETAFLSIRSSEGHEIMYPMNCN